MVCGGWGVQQTLHFGSRSDFRRAAVTPLIGVDQLNFVAPDGLTAGSLWLEQAAQYPDGVGGAHPEVGEAADLDVMMAEPMRDEVDREIADQNDEEQPDEGGCSRVVQLLLELVERGLIPAAVVYAALERGEGLVHDHYSSDAEQKLQASDPERSADGEVCGVWKGVDCDDAEREQAAA